MEPKIILKYRGFTLIELIVSIFIISVLVSLGYANFRRYAQKQALWAVARQIEGDLRLAQSYAMSGKDATSCSVGTYLYGYRLVKSNSSSYKIQSACRNPQDGSFTYTDAFSTRYITSGFEVYNNFTSVLFRSVVGGVDNPASIGVRRISTTNPYIVISVSQTGVISLSYND
jgi:prepilin-type N-terminal cleavage/methylation domain-containing protein